MTFVFSGRLRSAFAPPQYLTLPLSGIDVSTSGVKAVRLAEGAQGIVLASYAEAKLLAVAFTDGEIVDREAVVGALASAAKAAGISSTNAALPESKSYLFEAAVKGSKKAEWRIGIEQRLDELITLPPPETSFDIVEVGKGA